MKSFIRPSLAVLALTAVAQIPAHAQGIGICIPLVTCVSVGTGGGSGSGSGSNGAASAPEISANMIGTGLALVAGIAAMMPRRTRKHSTRITDM